MFMFISMSISMSILLFMSRKHGHGKMKRRKADTGEKFSPGSLFLHRWSTALVRHQYSGILVSPVRQSRGGGGGWGMMLLVPSHGSFTHLSILEIGEGIRIQIRRSYVASHNVLVHGGNYRLYYCSLCVRFIHRAGWLEDKTQQH
jgi:hypothetical protein